MKKIKFIISSFFSLLILLNSFIAIADSSIEIYSNDYNYDPPVIQLIYPKGGETLNDTITIKWIAYHSDTTYDHVKISIYFKEKNSDNWIEIINSYPNLGEYNWSTNKLIDDIYIVRLLAIDGDNNIGIATSEDLKIYNDSREQTCKFSKL